jgi:transposase
MHVAEHNSCEELQRWIRQQKDARLLLRVQIVRLAKQGQTAPQISQLLSLSRRQVQHWVRQYNAQGLDGLADRRRGGNQRRLSDAQEQQIQDYLDQQAQDPHAGVRRAEDLRAWIQQQFGKLYSLPGLYNLLHRLDYSCLMPRPRHHKGDPAAQEAFKKKPWSRSSRSPKIIRARRSRSGSRTKLDSASKAP